MFNECSSESAVDSNDVDTRNGSEGRNCKQTVKKVVGRDVGSGRVVI